MGRRIRHKLFTDMAGVKLDVGCGANKQAGFIGIDRERLPGVDIVHDIQRFPWPVPANCATMILLSHLWEHVEPKYRHRLMDECWRICRHDGQLLISAPYATSFLAFAHPEHYGCPNEATFQFYDPDYALYHSGGYGKLRPWRIVRNDANLTGCIEVILEPRKDWRGRICLPKDATSATKRSP